MKYSISILVTRQIVGLICAGLATLLAKWIDPETSALVVDHIWQIVVLVILAVFGVDLTAYHQAKAKHSS